MTDSKRPIGDIAWPRPPEHVDASTEAYARATEAYTAAVEAMTSDLFAWRTYAAAAIGACVGDDANCIDPVALVTRVADDMLAQEKARFPR